MSNIEHRSYRATFILDNRENNESVDEIITRITESINSFDGEVDKVENLGVKEFARTAVRDFLSGPYVQIDFRSGTNGPVTLKENLHLDKTINRVVITSNN
ncbi:MAG: 30S ribosomal protein S6 [Opitutae bacterium]|jgi:small subunit ribosomal protein S6|nr:30S ribosomal protein S6 [Opitutae bacterium]MBT4224030.1 30S ribosomal protein S6 [Opitutae bacterium]MBT5380398.1 30S ribosomal protein S6 [Opitutae bacterium]MBT5693056.1 30S ribosomal protein S6 [Opitutae bacterium]MBT6463494.1 30S ribosomal protein S6 [Opitutae bacterium]